MDLEQGPQSFVPHTCIMRIRKTALLMGQITCEYSGFGPGGPDPLGKAQPGPALNQDQVMLRPMLLKPHSTLCSCTRRGSGPTTGPAPRDSKPSNGIQPSSHLAPVGTEVSSLGYDYRTPPHWCWRTKGRWSRALLDSVNRGHYVMY